ncbi:DUF1599 domain-containing protein [Aerococcus sp. L_32]|uniref:DUF1599 domain-containing protein n=1 Tax=Aerococcus sp. L_32 TaxID=3422316 RepID=UPI003D6B4318
MDKQANFKAITTEMSELYSKKNHDYGDAFGQTFAELGIISAITRISDKTNRLKSLATKDQRVDDERIEDTLIDLANYAVMTLIELRDNDKQSIETVIAYADGGPVFSTELLTKPIAGVYKCKVYRGRLNLLKDLKHDGFEWLARDYDGDLCAYGNKPEKYELYWLNDEGSVVIKKDNFPQIKWLDSQPTSIESAIERLRKDGDLS